MHTQWSDGSASVQEMAEAADARGYEYIAITDHSKAIAMAFGLDEKRVVDFAQTVRKINESGNLGIRIFSGLECDIMKEGEMDIAWDALAELDIVLGCFHSSLRKKDDQTDRYVAALRNPAIQILGHPRGRIYNFRLGLSADWAHVFAVAAELDKAIEIDSYPDRQDMSIDLIRLARKAGCRISIGTDSHGPSQLEFIEFGLAAALKAKIDPDRILNFMSRAKLMEWAVGQRDRDSGRLAS